MVLADSDLFGDDCIGELDHRALWCNLVGWAAASALALSDQAARDGAVSSDAAWTELRDETNALALLQAPDGSLAGDAGQAGRHVERMIDAIGRLAPRFEHQGEYLDAVRADLREWADRGFERPDFTASLEAFRPERYRRDGVETSWCSRCTSRTDRVTRASRR